MTKQEQFVKIWLKRYGYVWNLSMLGTTIKLANKLNMNHNEIVEALARLEELWDSK